MPILEIEIVLHPGEILMSDLAAQLANAGARILQSQPRGTWVKLKSLDSVQYAENDSGSGLDFYPVFVKVLKYRLEQDRTAYEADQLAEAIGLLCSRPKENVHVIFEPEGRGRVAFGGKLSKE